MKKNINCHWLFILSAIYISGYGCSTDDKAINYVADYIGIWTLESPLDGTMNMVVDAPNGDGGVQPENLILNGELMISLEILEDSTLNVYSEFVTMEFPCSVQAPCNLQAESVGQHKHQYLGRAVSQEGLDAHKVKFTNESNDHSEVGYAYTAENRLCISYNLAGMVFEPQGVAPDPVAINFDHCFFRQSTLE